MSIFYEEQSVFVFLILTVTIGGGAAWLTGRAMAIGWRPLSHLAFFMMVLGAVVRFFHFALFDGTLLSLHYYLVDTTVLLIMAGLGFRLTRTRQMVSKYSWLYERTGLFTWKERKA